MALTAKEIKLKKFGSSQVAKRTVEDIVLEQIALKLADTDTDAAAAANSEYKKTLLWNIDIAAVSFDDVADPTPLQLNGEAAGANQTVSGIYPSLDTMDRSLVIDFASGNSNIKSSIPRSIASDKLIIEARFVVSGITAAAPGTENDIVAGIGISVRGTSDGVAIERINFRFNPETGAVQMTKFGVPGIQTTDGNPLLIDELSEAINEITLRLEKKGSSYKFIVLAGGGGDQEIGSIIYNSPSVKDPYFNASLTEIDPLLLISGVNGQLRYFNVFTPVSSPELMLIGEDVLAGRNISYTQSIAALLNAELAHVQLADIFAKKRGIAEITAISPKVALLWCGHNDLFYGEGVTAEDVADNIQVCVNKLIKAGIVPVVTLLPPSSVVAWNTINDLNELLTDRFAATCNMLDLSASQLNSANAPAAAFYENDLWHLNAAGHQLVADLITQNLDGWDLTTIPDLI